MEGKAPLPSLSPPVRTLGPEAQTPSLGVPKSPPKRPFRSLLWALRLSPLAWQSRRVPVRQGPGPAPWSANSENDKRRPNKEVGKWAPLRLPVSIAGFGNSGAGRRATRRGARWAEESRAWEAWAREGGAGRTGREE